MCGRLCSSAGLARDVKGLKEGQAALDKRVTKLEIGGGAGAIDMSLAAFTQSQHCEPYTLVFSDVPLHPDTLTLDLIVQLGSQVGVRFESKNIHDVWRASRRDASGPNQVDPAARPPDLFVKFRFAWIRNAILAEMRKRKGINFQYPGVAQNVKIKAYEVLTSERHARFAAISRVALERGISVWHLDGAIKGRSGRGGKPVYLSCPADLDALRHERD